MQVPSDFIIFPTAPPNVDSLQHLPLKKKDSLEKKGHETSLSFPSPSSKWDVGVQLAPSSKFVIEYIYILIFTPNTKQFSEIFVGTGEMRVE